MFEEGCEPWPVRRPAGLFVLFLSPPRLLTRARVLYFRFVLACFVVWSASFGRLSVGVCVCMLSVVCLC